MNSVFYSAFFISIKFLKGGVRYGQRLIEDGKKRTRSEFEVNFVPMKLVLAKAGNGDRYSKSASIKRSRVGLGDSPGLTRLFLFSWDFL